MFPLFEAMLSTPILRVVERDNKTDHTRVVDIKHIPKLNIETYIKNYISVILRKFNNYSATFEESEVGYNNLLTLIISDDIKEYKITLENIDDQTNTTIKTIFDKLKFNKLP